MCNVRECARNSVRAAGQPLSPTRAVGRRDRPTRSDERIPLARRGSRDQVVAAGPALPRHQVRGVAVCGLHLHGHAAERGSATLAGCQGGVPVANTEADRNDAAHVCLRACRSSRDDAGLCARHRRAVQRDARAAGCSPPVPRRRFATDSRGRALRHVDAIVRAMDGADGKAAWRLVGRGRHGRRLVEAHLRMSGPLCMSGCRSAQRTCDDLCARPPSVS